MLPGTPRAAVGFWRKRPRFPRGKPGFGNRLCCEFYVQAERICAQNGRVESSGRFLAKMAEVPGGKRGTRNRLCCEFYVQAERICAQNGRVSLWAVREVRF